MYADERRALAHRLMSLDGTRYFVASRAGRSTLEPRWAPNPFRAPAQKVTRVWRDPETPERWEPFWAWPCYLLDEFCGALRQAAYSFQIWDDELKQFLGAPYAGHLEHGWRAPAFSPEATETVTVERAPRMLMDDELA